MNSLAVIAEELEEQLPDECSELVQNLMRDLKIALKKVEDYEEQLEKNEMCENKIKELTGLCQSKNAEVFALERKVKELRDEAEEKDKQIISMLSMVKEFKLLVESSDKSTQTEYFNNHVEEHIVQREEKNSKPKNAIASQVEEINNFKTHDIETKEYKSIPEILKKKVEPKIKPGGYLPVFLRKPK